MVCLLFVGLSRLGFGLCVAGGLAAGCGVVGVLGCDRRLSCCCFDSGWL